MVGVGHEPVEVVLVVGPQRLHDLRLDVLLLGPSGKSLHGCLHDGSFGQPLLLVLVVGFCLFYVVNQPEGAAAAVRTAFLAVGTAFGSIITFFTSLAS